MVVDIVVDVLAIIVVVVSIVEVVEKDNVVETS